MSEGKVKKSLLDRRVYFVSLGGVALCILGILVFMLNISLISGIILLGIGLVVTIVGLILQSAKTRREQPEY